jgi:hypothetical protein
VSIATATHEVSARRALPVNAGDGMTTAPQP